MSPSITRAWENRGLTPINAHQLTPMKTRYKQFNPKRRIASSGHASQAALDALAQRVRYGGNPEHKRNPGDFGLTPPADPRPGKSLCDTAALFRRSEALHVLQAGVRKGLISDRHEGEWPKNVWSVTSSGIPLEAQLENAAKGVYHGYPMPESDPLAAEVLSRWSMHD